MSRGAMLYGTLSCALAWHLFGDLAWHPTVFTTCARTKPLTPISRIYSTPPTTDRGRRGILARLSYSLALACSLLAAISWPNSAGTNRPPSTFLAPLQSHIVARRISTRPHVMSTWAWRGPARSTTLVPSQLIAKPSGITPVMRALYTASSYPT